MEKTQKILKHLFDLYGETEWSEKDVIGWCQKNAERYSAWNGAFENIDEDIVLHAIDFYWRYKSNKTQPTIAKLLAIIFTDDNGKNAQQKAVRYYNLASELMSRDIALGRCKHLIGDYNRAVDYIVEDILVKEMPASEWAKLSYSQKIEQARQKGLFGQFDEVLEMLCDSDFY